MNHVDDVDAAAADGPPTPDAERSDRKRSGISILTLLLIVAFAAIWLARLGLTQEKSRILRRLIDLRQSTGELVVLYPDRLAAATKPKFHAEQVWEVYIPPGRSYELRLATEQIIDKETPSEFEAVAISPGLHEVELVQEEVCLLRDDRPDHIDIKILVDGRDAITVRKEIGWRGNSHAFYNDPAAHGLHHSPDEPLTLLRTTFHTHVGGRIPANTGPSDGILLWLAPR